MFYFFLIIVNQYFISIFRAQTYRMNIDLALIKKQFLFVIVLLILLCVPIFAISQDRQKGQNSEVLVSYDYASPESKTVIPFDKYFTFQVLHFNNQKIREIKVYESCQNAKNGLY